MQTFKNSKLIKYSKFRLISCGRKYSILLQAVPLVGLQYVMVEYPDPVYLRFAYIQSFTSN